jgi:hypothetical protein
MKSANHYELAFGAYPRERGAAVDTPFKFD